MDCLLEEMNVPLYQLLEQFMKEDKIKECKTNKDLLTLNVSDAGMQIKLETLIMEPKPRHYTTVR